MAGVYFVSVCGRQGTQLPEYPNLSPMADDAENTLGSAGWECRRSEISVYIWESLLIYAQNPLALNLMI